MNARAIWGLDPARRAQFPRKFGDFAVNRAYREAELAFVAQNVNGNGKADHEKDRLNNEAVGK